MNTLQTPNTSSLANRIERLIAEARKTVISTVNTTMVYTYYEIGKMIVEEEQEGKERAEYGTGMLKAISKQLITKYGRGFSYTNLEQMRKFYKVYSTSIPQTLSEESAKRQFTLSWSHYLKLMRITNPDERHFYEIEATNNNWSLRELERQFDSSLYERLVLSRDTEAIKTLAEKGQIIEEAQDMIKDPYILEFVGLPELPQYSESELEQRLIDNLQIFLLELGKGFTFVGRQVRFTFDEQHFRVDLVFYNRLLRAFVLIDLKRGMLRHQDLGQMQMYVNYYDRFVKLEDENPTIGILLCTDKSDAMVEITLPKDNNQIFASKYQTVLPSKEELKQLIKEQYK
jgi:predicted nuclease of restriction endonuclease-like (RecB) superfamily